MKVMALFKRVTMTTYSLCSLGIILSTVKPVYNGHPWDLKNVDVTQRVD
jgi:hypothetical protein